MLALSLGKLTLFLSTLSAAYSAPTLTSLSSSRANSSSILSSEALNTTTVASSSTQLITTTASSAPSSSSTPTTSVQLNLTSSTQSPSFTTLLASTSTQSSNLTSTSTTTSVQSTQTLSSDLTTIRDRHISISISALNASLVANISSWISTLGDDGKWPDTEIDYTTGCDARRANWPAEDHWNRIETMAAAWHGGLEGAEEYVNDTDVLDAVSRAMDYWFENDFTESDCLYNGGNGNCPCGTPGFWNTNWFSNVIGIPELVGDSCLFVGTDTLTPTQLANCTHITARAFGTFNSGESFLSGANILDIAKIGIEGGLLAGNASVLADGFTRIHEEVVVHNETTADGIRADGSFGQHSGIIYNGNYGKDYTNDVLALEIAAAGTEYSATEADTGSQSAFETLLDGDLWMIYRNVDTDVLHWDFSVLNRFITFVVADEQATASILINVTQIAELGDLWDSDTLKSVAETLDSASNDANVGEIKGNRMYYDNDYMVQRGSGYVSTLRMFSTRTVTGECTNSQNPFGFHLGDGVLYTYLQGGEYEDIAGEWDWNLIPGITTDYAATPLSCDEVRFAGKEAFVGGASDGTIGAAAMRYTNPYTGTLSFQKAWFFLDDDVQHIMVSSAETTSNPSTNPLISVLDQKRLNGDVVVDGQTLSQGGNFTNATTLWHDNVGYVFDNSSTASLSVDWGVRTGNWSTIGISAAGVTSATLFSAWLDHSTSVVSNGTSNGTVLSAAPISYTVYPGTTQDGFARKSRQSHLQTVQNDAYASAVYDEVHHTLAVVFWDASGGSVTFAPSLLLGTPLTVAADGNAAVLYRLAKGEVTVADPSQTLASVNVSLSVSEGGNVPIGWGASLGLTMNVELPSGGIAGKSVTQSLFNL